MLEIETIQFREGRWAFVNKLFDVCLRCRLMHAEPSELQPTELMQRAIPAAST